MPKTNICRQEMVQITLWWGSKGGKGKGSKR